jgi:hypothetical protein
MGSANRCSGGCVSRRGGPVKRPEKTPGTNFFVRRFNDLTFQRITRR